MLRREITLTETLGPPSIDLQPSAAVAFVQQARDRENVGSICAEEAPCHCKAHTRLTGT